MVLLTSLKKGNFFSSNNFTHFPHPIVIKYARNSSYLCLTIKYFLRTLKYRKGKVGSKILYGEFDGNPEVKKVNHNKVIYDFWYVFLS